MFQIGQSCLAVEQVVAEHAIQIVIHKQRAISQKKRRSHQHAVERLQEFRKLSAQIPSMSGPFSDASSSEFPFLVANEHRSFSLVVFSEHSSSPAGFVHKILGVDRSSHVQRSASTKGSLVAPTSIFYVRMPRMKAAVNLLWVLLCVLGALALAHVVGAVNPTEKVNGLWLVVAAACIYVLAYRFYGRWLAKQVVGLNNQHVTPAVRLNDGVNFHPTNKVVLFGHHFAAIAGAGPLLGPVLAAQFGFMPGFLWLVIGAVLAGAVQDFIILVASMRRNGRSLPEIAHDELGSITGTATAVAVLFIVVVALAGLGFAVVNALYHNAWGTFTIAMTIPIGLLMGFYLQKFRPGAVAEVSILGVVLLIAAVLYGRVVAQSSYAWLFEFDKPALIWLLAGYGFLASVLPGWMLLVPRGYLSTFMKLGVVFLLGFGVILMAPTIEMPRVTTFANGGGPIIPGTLFPFLFITIACGAISGFHSLVSSGTTPKMIEQESQAVVGYAAMLLESFVGVMALIAASVLIPGDYLAINTTLGADALTAMGFAPSRIARTVTDGRGGCGGTARRRRVFGRRHGVDLFGVAWHGGFDGLLVSIRAGVRGVVHSDDDRYWDARGALSHPGNGGAGLCALSPDELGARASC